MKTGLYFQIICCCLALQLSAQIKWDGDNAFGNLSYCNNWFGDSCPSWSSSSEFTIFFRNNPNQTSMYYDLSWNPVQSIIYADTFPTSMVFDSNGNGINFYWKIENYSTYAQTLNLPLSGKGSVMELNAVYGDLNFTKTIYNDNNVHFRSYGDNGNKVIFGSNCVLTGNSSVNFYLMKNSIVDMSISGGANYSGVTYVYAGQLWLNAGVSLNSSSIQLGNGDSVANKVYISHASTATTVSTPIAVVSNSTNATIGGLNTSNTHTYSSNLNLNNNTVTLDETNAGGTLVFAGAITGTGGITKTGLGTIRLNSTSNAYTGNTRVNAGVLQCGAAQAIPNNSPVILAGGTLSSGSSTGFSNNFSTLQLADNSTLALGTGSHSLQFTASNGVSWTSGKTLTITGWNGSCDGRIYIGTDASGLTSAQLNQIVFQGYGTGAQLTSTGELMPLSAVGTLSGAQSICKNSSMTALTLSGYSGSISKWQMASNAAFTLGVTDINATTSTLNSTQIGPLTATRYFRAVINTGVGSCATTYSNVVGVTVNTTTYNGSSWSNGTPNNTLMAIFAVSTNISADVTACSCQVTGNAVVQVNSGVNLTIAGEVNVANTASLIFQNSASLVQTDAAASNSGSIVYKRQTSVMANNYDFVYWSSPVSSATLSSFWMTNATGTFYSFSPSINDWASASGSSTMTPGLGYIARGLNGANGWSPGNSWAATFTGTPNNGNITTSIYRNGTNFNNLIGNPYPCALDIEAFYETNSSVITANFYFWTHNTAITTLGYTANDYAMYNAVLGAGVGAGTAANSGGNTPDRYVDAGQGFFCEGFNVGGTATFANSHRVSNNNNAFYRVRPGIERHRLWLSLRNSGGFYKQQLLAFAQGATSAYDDNLDALTFDAHPFGDFYSVVNQKACVIQSLGLPFQPDSGFDLGYKVQQAGIFNIVLDQKDAFFDQQKPYLYDAVTGQWHDFEQGPYRFYSIEGRFDHRFRLVFQTPFSVISAAHTPPQLWAYPSDNQLHVQSAEPLQRLQLLHINGQCVRDVEVNENEVVLDLPVATGIYLIKACTADGTWLWLKVSL